MICPNCQQNQLVTEHNYGALYTCPSCQAVYFINFDGQPEYEDMSSQDFQMPADGAVVEDDHKMAATQIQSMTVIADMSTQISTQISNSFEPSRADESLTELPSVAEGDGFNAFAMPPVGVEEPAPGIDFSHPASAVEPSPVAPAPLAAPPKISKAQAPIPIAVSQPAVPPESRQVVKPKQAPPVTPSATLSSPFGDFAHIAQEISDFGNADTQLATLNYDLHISGIDTAETKYLIQEAIEDSKFAWDSVEMMKSIKNGNLTILRITPAKAYLLAKRIQFLDIEKVWKQNALGS